MNILLSNIIEFNVAINIYCNVVPSQLLGIEWRTHGGGEAGRAPKSPFSRSEALEGPGLQLASCLRGAENTHNSCYHAGSSLARSCSLLWSSCWGV